LLEFSIATPTTLFLFPPSHPCPLHMGYYESFLPHPYEATKVVHGHLLQ